MANLEIAKIQNAALQAAALEVDESGKKMDILIVQKSIYSEIKQPIY